MEQLLPFIVIGGGIVVFILFIMMAWFGRLWIKALASGAHVSLFSLIGMALQGVNASVIVESRIMLKKANLDVPSDFFVAHYLARGNVPVLAKAMVVATQGGLALNRDEMASHVLAGGDIVNVVTALISASRANITLSFEQSCAIDLAGRDVQAAVATSVMPKVIDCPDPGKGRQTIDAVSMDGIQLRAKARVTVRMRIEQLIGGATEETIIARVGEGIVSAIGSAATHKQVLENPDRISKAVLSKGLDNNTAFEIVSIDIADVDVGDNIGARLQADQARADMEVAKAKAEERRAMAAAREQEMQAEVVENQAKVVLAQAEVPKAIAEAFRGGNLGIMDYQRYKNIQADTGMRDAIGGNKDKSD